MRSLNYPLKQQEKYVAISVKNPWYPFFVNTLLLIFSFFLLMINPAYSAGIGNQTEAKQWTFVTENNSHTNQTNMVANTPMEVLQTLQADHPNELVERLHQYSFEAEHKHLGENGNRRKTFFSSIPGLKEVISLYSFSQLPSATAKENPCWLTLSGMMKHLKHPETIKDPQFERLLTVLHTPVNTEEWYIYDGGTTDEAINNVAMEVYHSFKGGVEWVWNRLRGKKDSHILINADNNLRQQIYDQALTWHNERADCEPVKYIVALNSINPKLVTAQDKEISIADDSGAIQDNYKNSIWSSKTANKVAKCVFGALMLSQCISSGASVSVPTYFFAANSVNAPDNYCLAPNGQCTYVGNANISRLMTEFPYGDFIAAESINGGMIPLNHTVAEAVVPAEFSGTFSTGEHSLDEFPINGRIPLFESVNSSHIQVNIPMKYGVAIDGAKPALTKQILDNNRIEATLQRPDDFAAVLHTQPLAGNIEGDDNKIVVKYDSGPNPNFILSQRSSAIIATEVSGNTNHLEQQGKATMFKALNNNVLGNTAKIITGTNNKLIYKDISFYMDIPEINNIRLTNRGKPSNIEGRGSLEVLTAPRGIDSSWWGTVCSQGFSNASSLVACRQIGFDGDGHSKPDHRNSLLPVRLNNVNCVGNETSLLQCPHDSVNQYNCTQRPVRLYCRGAKNYNNDTVVYSGGLHNVPDFIAEAPLAFLDKAVSIRKGISTQNMVDTTKPGGWRKAYRHICKAEECDISCHYINEDFYSIVTNGNETLLVSRQRYPEVSTEINDQLDLKGLIRITDISQPGANGAIRLYKPPSDNQHLGDQTLDDPAVYTPPVSHVIANNTLLLLHKRYVASLYAQLEPSQFETAGSAIQLSALPLDVKNHGRYNSISYSFPGEDPLLLSKDAVFTHNKTTNTIIQYPLEYNGERYTLSEANAAYKLLPERFITAGYDEGYLYVVTKEQINDQFPGNGNLTFSRYDIQSGERDDSWEISEEPDYLFDEKADYMLEIIDNEVLMLRRGEFELDGIPHRLSIPQYGECSKVVSTDTDQASLVEATPSQTLQLTSDSGLQSPQEEPFDSALYVIPEKTPETKPMKPMKPMRPEIRPEILPSATEMIPEMTTEMTTEIMPEMTPEMKPTKPEILQPELEIRPEMTSEMTSEMKPNTTPEITLNTTPAMTPEMTPEMTSQITLQSTSQAVSRLISKSTSAPTLQSTPKMTSQTTLQSTSQAVSRLTSQSTSVPTLQSTTEMTSQTTLQSTSQAVSRLTSKSTSVPTLQSTPNTTSEIIPKTTLPSALETTSKITLNTTSETTSQTTLRLPSQSTSVPTLQSTSKMMTPNTTSQTTLQSTSQPVSRLTSKSTSVPTLQSTPNTTSEIIPKTTLPSALETTSKITLNTTSETTTQTTSQTTLRLPSKSTSVPTLQSTPNTTSEIIPKTTLPSALETTSKIKLNTTSETTTQTTSQTTLRLPSKSTSVPTLQSTPNTTSEIIPKTTLPSALETTSKITLNTTSETTTQTTSQTTLRLPSQSTSVPTLQSTPEMTTPNTTSQTTLQSTSQAVSRLTSQSTSVPTLQSTPEITTSNTTSQTILQSTSQAVSRLTSQSTSVPTLQSTTEMTTPNITSQTTLQSTSQAVSRLTSQSTSVPTLQSTPEITTSNTTSQTILQSTSQAVSRLTSQSTSVPTLQSTTEMTTPNITSEIIPKTTLPSALETTSKITLNTTSETTTQTTSQAVSRLTSQSTSVPTLQSTTEMTTPNITSEIIPKTTLPSALETTSKITLNTTSETTTQTTSQATLRLPSQSTSVPTLQSTPEMMTLNTTSEIIPKTTLPSALETTSKITLNTTSETTNQTTSQATLRLPSQSTSVPTLQSTPEMMTLNTTSEIIPKTTLPSALETTSKTTPNTTSETTSQTTSQATLRLPSQSTSVPTLQSTPEMMTLNTTSEIIPKTTLPSALETTSKITPNTTSETTSQATLRLPSQSTSVPTLQSTPEMTTPNTTSETTTQTTSQGILQTTSQVIPETTSQGIPETTSQVIPETTSQGILQITSQVIPETTSQVIPETTSQGIPETTSQSTSKIQNVGAIVGAIVGGVALIGGTGAAAVGAKIYMNKKYNVTKYNVNKEKMSESEKNGNDDHSNTFRTLTDKTHDDTGKFDIDLFKETNL